jgi:hypothetical protein
MFEQLLDEIPEGKVYRVNSVGIATFFGGFPVGAYLLSHNFMVIGDKKKAIATWVVAALLLVLMAASEFIPVLSRIPTIVYTLFFAFLASWTARHFQLSYINNHIQKGGEVYTNNRVVAVTLIGVVVLVALLLGIYLLTGLYNDLN